MADRVHVGEVIADELQARGWSVLDLATRMAGMDALAVEMLLAVREPGLLAGEELLRRIGVAFDVDPEFLVTIDRGWREEQAKNG